MHKLALFVIIFCSSSFVVAGGSQSFGDYTIDYNTFPSTLLTADVARAYNIKRSKYETLINVFISKEGVTGGIPVHIRGTAKNLMGQVQNLKFLEIKEDNTVYYIAPIRVTNEDLMHVQVVAKLPDSRKEMLLKFSKTFYRD